MASESHGHQTYYVPEQSKFPFFATIGLGTAILGAGFTLNWSEYGPAIGVSTYRDESIKSNIVRASHYTAEKVVNTNAGQLIATQYS